jgi:hypothetical protein
VHVKGCERFNVRDGLLDVAWFCACKLGGSLAGEMKVSFREGGWYNCACVRRQKDQCRSCLVRVTSVHYSKSIRMFEDDLEHALVIRGGSLGGLGWRSDVCTLKSVYLWAVKIL